MVGTYERLGVPVWASDLTVLRALRQRLIIDDDPRARRTQRHKLYRAILLEHTKARQLYYYVQTGRKVKCK